MQTPVHTHPLIPPACVHAPVGRVTRPWKEQEREMLGWLRRPSSQTTPPPPPRRDPIVYAQMVALQVVMASVIHSLPDAGKARVKDGIRYMLANVIGTMDVSSIVPPEEAQLFRDTYAAMLQVLLNFDPAPEDVA